MDLFSRYVLHVSYWVKGERVYNRVTGAYEDPDEKLMSSVEGVLDVEPPARATFRRDMISAVAGHAIDNPGVQVNYAKVFPRYHGKLREATYSNRKKQLAAIARDVIVVLSKDEGAVAALSADRRSLARGTLERLASQFGYAESSSRDAIGELLERRYAD